ncbi:MAG: ROK family protein [Bacteroidota bacterium]
MEKETTMIDPDKYWIGVDIGGTTIKAGVVNRDGKILEQLVAVARSGENPKAVVGQLVITVNELLKNRNRNFCGGIGIGCPGVVGLDSDTVSYPPNFADWRDVKVATEVRNKIPINVIVENDANVAALAEAMHGAGKDCKDFLFVIWGTGVGGGIINDHKIYRGPNGGAGEIGHASIRFDGPPCNCGNFGCIESYIGQRYLSRRTRELLVKYPDSSITNLVGGDLEKIEPAVIAEAATGGDKAAKQILEEAGTLLGYALASSMNIIDLNVAVIGGGISAAPEFVYDAMRSALQSRILKPHRPHVRVLRAQLGNAAGIIGAASLLM